MPHCCSHNHNCLEELSSDHQQILAALEELEKGKVKEFLEFTENFAEPHHRKEEKVLFPALEQKGMPKEGGPIGVMLQEHEAKRGYVKELKEALERGDKAKVSKTALLIADLLRGHIEKEDNILYPCAKDFLSEEELAGLATQCEKIK